VKYFLRIASVLVAGLLGACGGGGMGSGDAPGQSSPPPDARLVLDNVAWDQGDWAE
jgi:hypothetical protein